MNSTEVSINQNWLKYGGKLLTQDLYTVDNDEEKLPVSPIELSKILSIGRVAILNGIEDFYEVSKAKNLNSTIVRPSIFICRLGNNKNENRVLTETGKLNRTNVHTNILEIQHFQNDYFNVPKDFGFKPEVRSGLGGGKDLEGSWLSLRKPEIIDLANDLGFYRTLEMDNVRRKLEVFDLETKPLFGEYRKFGMKEVEKEQNSTRYALKQIGLLLDIADLKLQFGSLNEYEQEAADVIEYAENLDFNDSDYAYYNPFFGSTTLLAIKNSLWPKTY